MFENRRSVKGDYYWALQLPKSATQEAIEFHYGQLYPHYKGLVETGEEHYSELMNLVQEAYDVLSDPEKRRAFDETYVEEPTFAERMEEYRKLIDEADEILKPKTRTRPKPKSLREELIAKGRDYNQTATPRQSVPFQRPEKWTGGWNRLFIWWQPLLFIGANGLIFTIDYNASGTAWFFGILIGIIFFGAPAFGPAITQKNKAQLAKAIVFVASMLTVHFYTYFTYKFQDFYVDNQTSQEVYVMMDGEELTELSPYDYAIVSVRPGTHRFETYTTKGDSLLEEFTASVSFNERWMYNVLSAGVYKSGEQVYSSTPFFSDTPQWPEYPVTGRWIRLKYSYIFEYPPSSITVERKLFDNDDVIRTYLVRKDQNAYDYLYQDYP